MKTYLKMTLAAMSLISLGSAFASSSPEKDETNRPPVPRLKVNAQWPFEMRRTSTEGYVILRLTVDKGGHPRDITPVRASHHDFIESAVKAVQKWRYKPALIDGAPAAVTIEETIVFRLN
jgi:periplasmic protein TonB